MNNKKLNILVTNDDGIFAKGINSLVEVALEFGDVCVVAPDKPQSGMGHAITIHDPIRLKKFDFGSSITSFSCSGTPVDCVKLGVYEVLKSKPDLILSGINHGDNSSTNVLYSGTMSAAIEGALENIPSIGISLCDYNSEADFSGAQWAVKRLLGELDFSVFPSGTCLNVNIPKMPREDLKGLKICRQGHAFWEDRFDKRLDQFNQEYYWLTGQFSGIDKREGTDLEALQNGYVSIVPTHFDLTAFTHMDKFKFLES